jgi:hypothetical protein
VHFRSRVPAAERRDPAELRLARLATHAIHEADGRVLVHSRQLAILMPIAGG